MQNNTEKEKVYGEILAITKILNKKTIKGETKHFLTVALNKRLNRLSNIWESEKTPSLAEELEAQYLAESKKNFIFNVIFAVNCFLILACSIATFLIV